MIRIELPQHLRTLAHVDREVQIEVVGAVTQRSVRSTFHPMRGQLESDCAGLAGGAFGRGADAGVKNALRFGILG